MSFVADYNLPHFPTLCSPVLVLVPTALARDCYWAHCKGPLPPPSPHRVGSTRVRIVPPPPHPHPPPLPPARRFLTPGTPTALAADTWRST